MTKFARILMSTAIMLALAGLGHAWTLDFEWGLGNDGGAIASGVPGVQFTTTDGYDWLYADILNGAYSAYSINMNYGPGPYMMYGYVTAWLGYSQGSGRIDFTNKDGSYFTTGYCSASDFYLEAYDEFDNLPDQAVGGANAGQNMDFLSVSSASNNIAYIMIHDTGNHFDVDNMSGDATGVISPNVPEPTTMALLGLGLLGMGARLRRK